MSWREAKSLLQLRKQIDAAHPDRDRSSDGTIGDLAHSQRKSDHNPNAAGVVTAMDIDADLSPTEDVGVIVKQLQVSRDPRIKYIIYRGQITVKGDVTKWKPYHGPNGHFHHMHISVSSDPHLYDDETPWFQTGQHTELPPLTGPIVLPPATYKLGDRGNKVTSIQAKLVILGLYRGRADGIFGEQTRKAVVAFQTREGLREDGIAGPNTLKALGL